MLPTDISIETTLTAELTDASNVSLSGRYYNLVVWGVVSEDDADCQLMVNLPIGSYNASATAIDDLDATAVYEIPNDFRGTGFLIARLTVRHQVAGDTFSIEQNTDLRGLFPSTGAGGSGGGAGGGGAHTLSIAYRNSMYSCCDTVFTPLRSVQVSTKVLPVRMGSLIEPSAASSSPNDTVTASPSLAAINVKFTPP